MRLYNAILVLFGICLGFVSVAILSNQFTFHWVFIICIFLIAIFPYVYESRTGSIDPFAPIMWNAPLFALTFGVSAARRIISRDFVFIGTFYGTSQEAVILKVLFFSLIGLLFVVFGYYVSWGKKIATRLPYFEPTWSSKRAWTAIIVLMILGSIGYLSLLTSIGSGPRSHLAKGGSKWAFILVNLLYTASVLIIADILISSLSYSEKSISIKHWYKSLLVIPIIWLNIYLLWTLGGRGRAFGIFVVGVFLFHYSVRRFSLLEGLAIFTIVKIIPSWAASVMAAIITLDIENIFSSIQNFYLFYRTPATPFNNIVILFSGVPEQQDYVYGETFFSGFFEVLPLQPFRETNTVYNHVFYPEIQGDYGVPITLLGETYLNFGFLGIIIGMITVGIIMRFVYEWLVIQQDGPPSIVIFSTISNGFLLFGNFSNSFPQLGLKILPLIICLIYISGIRK